MINVHQTNLPVLELRVPMCCEKCREKVKEELEELEGVQSVICDQYNQRVTVTGFVDPLRALKKVKKVKKKSEFFNAGSYIDQYSTQGHRNNNVNNMMGVGGGIMPSGGLNREALQYTGKPLMHLNSFGRPPNYDGSKLVRSNSFGRNNNLPRLPSFGKVVRFNNDGGAGSRQQDFAPQDMQRDYYGVRRMPSFKKHRYHDAEYISMGDQYTPQASETHYVGLHHNQQRPMLRSEVSFSKLPVGNPNYLKQVDSAHY
jgi:copper chaperone CopZ